MSHVNSPDAAFSSDAVAVLPERSARCLGPVGMHSRLASVGSTGRVDDLFRVDLLCADLFCDDPLSKPCATASREPLLRLSSSARIPLRAPRSLGRASPLRRFSVPATDRFPDAQFSFRGADESTVPCVARAPSVYPLVDSGDDARPVTLIFTL